MEYRRNSNGSVTEVPPAVLDCGHRFGPRLVIVGYGARPGDPDGRRCRTYICRACGATTYAG